MEPNSYGGPGEVFEYLKSKDPSPCAVCSGLGGEKDACSLTCGQLEQWQVGTGALPMRGEVRAIWRMGKNGMMQCGMCSGRLRCEDSLVYCELCLRVHVKLKAGCGTEELVGYLMGYRWTVEQIAGLLEMGVEHIMQAARLQGYSFIEGADDGRKLMISKYARRYSVRRAAVKFDGLSMIRGSSFLRIPCLRAAYGFNVSG